MEGRKGLVPDISDDQQDIARGKGMVDSLFQAPTGMYNFDNTMGGFYIVPAFMDKFLVHISKNFMTLPKIKGKQPSK
ncbi:ribulose bisphosphate carboxylase oxygenase activase, chloroplastic isoform X2 [Olea europaea subsp. europaea]|uniref:Ribulose bisphosphate carboxylase oxygenase activase, chloroplastic isoform X2 n=1 Tax=Olea europaea subsp. europaea TaxID=158383 RepID=A0A8S0Q282_OLEEU|nr:ribulose bisphosphate carboxylase oxygenase activase, chloroplastic isoform X2 [Olea europaea subsp. europaea]